MDLVTAKFPPKSHNTNKAAQITELTASPRYCTRPTSNQHRPRAPHTHDGYHHVGLGMRKRGVFDTGPPSLCPSAGAAARLGLQVPRKLVFFKPPKSGGTHSADSPEHAYPTMPTVVFLAKVALALCKNARSVEVEEKLPDHFTFNVDSVIQDVFRFDKESCPQNLERLSIQGSQPGCFMSRIASPTEGLPGLRDLRFRGITPYLHEKPSPTPWNHSNLGLLTRLELVDCFVSKESLAALLSCCTALEDFICSLWRESASPYWVTNLLNQHCPGLRQTLRSLTLTRDGMKSSVDHSGYGSLRNLGKLEELCLGAGALLSTENASSLVPGAVLAQPCRLAHILPPKP